MNEQNQPRFQIFKLVISGISLIFLVILVFLIHLETKDLTYRASPILILIYIISGLMVGILMISSIMEVKEYVSHYRGLRDDSFHSHRLSFKQVVDNEYRKQIIETIFENNGIQYNQLRKKCNLQPGQFRWHIGVLLTYRVIRKQKIGQNVVYFPMISNEEENDFNIILKFPLRETIYQLIQSHPGIIQNEIARKLDIPNQRNKVKYHIDKLISANYITTIQNGKRKELHPK